MHHSVDVYAWTNRYKGSAERDYLIAEQRAYRSAPSRRFLSLVRNVIRRKTTPKPQPNKRQTVA